LFIIELFYGFNLSINIHYEKIIIDEKVMKIISVIHYSKCYILKKMNYTKYFTSQINVLNKILKFSKYINNMPPEVKK
jgi:hypothetical protein